MNNRINEIEKINKVKRLIDKTISRYLKKNYSDKELLEATLNYADEIGFFKKSAKKKYKYKK